MDLRCYAACHDGRMRAYPVPILQVKKMDRPCKYSQSSFTSIVFVRLPGGYCSIEVPNFSTAVKSRLICMQAVFSLGFALASVYHICHMHDEGLHKSEVFGISGPLWRTWDILCAQWLLARTFGHAVGARHWATQGVIILYFSAPCCTAIHS